MTVKQKEVLAKKMRTSRKYLDLNYIKILPNTQTQTPTTMATIETTEPKPVEMNAYQKQLLRSSNYYDKNKEKVLNKQKEYRSTISNEQKARAKIIYYLNNDENYKNKIKPQTVYKYKITVQNGVWQ